VSPVSVPNGLPSLASHNLIDLSELPEAIIRPLGEKATEIAGPVCPESMSKRCPRSPPDVLKAMTINSKSRTAAMPPPIVSRRIRGCRLPATRYHATRQGRIAGTKSAHRRRYIGRGRFEGSAAAGILGGGATAGVGSSPATGIFPAAEHGREHRPRLCCYRRRLCRAASRHFGFAARRDGFVWPRIESMDRMRRSMW